MLLYTIGHSAHPIDKFINLLKTYQIQLLVDVRSVPASRWHPQYNKHALQRVLLENQIDYDFAGKQLGGRPKDPTCYKPGDLAPKNGKPPKADFSEIMKRNWFVIGINTLVQHIPSTRTVILCSEELPLRCHRHGLIARYLIEVFPDIEIQHIRGNGRLESARELFRTSEKQVPGQLSFL